MIRFISVTAIFLLTSCAAHDKPINEDSVCGLYKRDYRGKVDYVCIKRDKSYSHFVEVNGNKKTLTEDKWNFNLSQVESRIGLSNFEKYGMSAPIVFCDIKNSVVIKMGNSHFEDFIKIDSTSCRNKSP